LDTACTRTAQISTKLCRLGRIVAGPKKLSTIPARTAAVTSTAQMLKHGWHMYPPEAFVAFCPRWSTLGDEGSRWARKDLRFDVVTLSGQVPIHVQLVQIFCHFIPWMSLPVGFKPSSHLHPDESCAAGCSSFKLNFRTRCTLPHSSAMHAA